MAKPLKSVVGQHQSSHSEILQPIKQKLLSAVSIFFNGQSQIKPDDFTILLGIYRKLKYPAYPFEDEARTKRLGIQLRYMLEVDRRPIDVVSRNKPPYHFVAGQSMVNTSKKDVRRLHLSVARQRADLVWDDLEEMKRAGFNFASSVADISQPTRARNFGQNLNKVLVSGDVAPQSSHVFRENAAIRCTYDEELNYYAKWRKRYPTQPSDREFAFDKLGDDYLKRNFYEPELKRESVHLLLVLDNWQILLELVVENGHLGLHLIYNTVKFEQDELYQAIFDRLSDFKKREAIFFYTMDGGDTTPNPLPISQQSLDPLVGADEQLVDPKCMVKRLWEVDCAAPDEGEQKYWGDWEWFAEMVQLYFPSRVVEVSGHGIKMFHAPDREALFLKDMRQAEAQAKGNLKIELAKLLHRAKEDEGLLYLPQGLATGGVSTGGERLLVGSDDLYVYLRNIETGLTSRVPTAQFVAGFRIGHIAKDIYERTKIIIPFTILVLTLGAGAIAGGVVGFGVLATGFKKYVQDTSLRETTKRAIQKTLDAFDSQIKAMLIYGVLLILPKTDNPIHRFSLGFLDGYTISSITTLFNKYKEFVVSGPRYYRWYKLFKRIRATIRLLEMKLETLKARVDEATAENLTKRIVEVAQNSHAGAILLFSNLLFLEYEQAEETISMFYQLAGKKPPTKYDWERMRTERFRSMLQRFSEEVKHASTQVTSEVDHIYDIMRFSLSAVLTVTELIHISRYSVQPVPVLILAGIGGATFLIGEDIIKNEGQASRDVLDMIKWVSPKTLNLLKQASPEALKLIARQFYKADLHEYKPNEVQMMGKIMGHLFGAFMINGAIFRKDTKLGQLVHKPVTPRDKAIGAFLSHEFGHGYGMPIFKVVLFHYFILFERHKGNAEKLWKDVLEELGVILLGDQAHLQNFQADVEKKFTYAKVKLLLVRLDELLTDKLKELATTPNLAQKLQAMAVHLESARLPSFEDILEGKQPKEWSREAMLFVMVSHLHMALLQFAKAINLIEQPVDPDGKDPLTILEFLEILGIEIDEERATNVLGGDLQELFQHKPQGRP